MGKNSIKLNINPSIKFVAADKDGKVYLYNTPPSINEVAEKWEGNYCLGAVNDMFDVSYLSSLDWKKSLHKINQNGELISIRECPPIDTKVLVSDYAEGKCYYRYSAGYYDDKGHLVCFPNGLSSWVMEDVNRQAGEPTSWEHWKLYQPKN